MLETTGPPACFGNWPPMCPCESSTDPAAARRPPSTPASALRGSRSSVRSIRTSSCGPAGCGGCTAELDDPQVAAAQGQYTHDRDARWCARVMGLDLEQRYAAERRREVTHVCTGNSAYRASALRQVGLFDESLGYGYDNDMSYRLREAGYRLALCPDARSMHRWRDGLAGYLSQQYGFGYGRIDLVAKHPRWVGGDSVAPAAMMAHPLLMLAALVGLAFGATLKITGGPSGWPFAAALALIAILMGERLAAGVSAALRFRTATALLFPVLHLLRDLAWVAAVARWSGRRLLRHAASPSHSMRSRASLSGAPNRWTDRPREDRQLERHPASSE